MDFLGIKAHWASAIAGMAVSVTALGADINNIALSEPEEKLRQAYQQHFICYEERLKSAVSKPQWEILDECLASATQGIPDIKQPTDLYKHVSKIVKAHGFLAVMSNEERPVAQLFKRVILCAREEGLSAPQISQDSHIQNCKSRHNVTPEDHERLAAILQKYGPDSMR